MPTLLIGNAAPIDVHKTSSEVDGETIDVIRRVDRGDLGAQICTVEIPDDHVSDVDLEAIAGHPRWGARMRGLPEEQRRFYLHRELVDDAWWTAHSNDPPEWVECDDEPALAALIADHFSTATHKCRVGRPKSWEEGRELPADYAGRGGGSVSGGGLPEWRIVRHGHEQRFDVDEYLEAIREAELRTTVGTDAAFGQHLSTSAQPASFNYIALTANATAPATSDTTLTAEIATASGGLIRKQAAFSHTNGTNTAALSATFTANGSDVLPVTLAKFGIFNAGAVGTMGYTTLISPTATLSASGDNMALTDTFTLT